MTTMEWAKSVKKISKSKALKFCEHCQVEPKEFFAEFGIKEEYNAVKIAEWLGY